MGNNKAGIVMSGRDDLCQEAVCLFEIANWPHAYPEQGTAVDVSCGNNAVRELAQPSREVNRVGALGKGANLNEHAGEGCAIPRLYYCYLIRSGVHPDTGL